MIASACSVAIQGDPGAFSHQAARQLFGGHAEILPCRTFRDLFAAVLDGRAEVGVVPVENTLAGPVAENLDLLADSPVQAVGETEVRVELCLIAPPGRTEDSLARVASHPVALRQCRRYFTDRPDIVEVPAWDTAGSVRDLLEGRGDWDAALGSALAAELYHGVVLRRGLEDDPRNHTRFLAIRSGRAGGVPSSPKASLAFSLPHRPGALHRALGVFAERAIDVCWIVSRPIPGQPWHYRFHLDVESGSGSATDLADALAALGERTDDVRMIGSF